jgi:hypothetical protein
MGTNTPTGMTRRSTVLRDIQLEAELRLMIGSAGGCPNVEFPWETVSWRLSEACIFCENQPSFGWFLHFLPPVAFGECSIDQNGTVDALTIRDKNPSVGQDNTTTLQLPELWRVKCIMGYFT